MSKPEVLVVAQLWSPLLKMLADNFVTHDRLHLVAPDRFALEAKKITAIVASGESKVSADLMRSLPSLQVISVFGVGYDGLDLAQAAMRGIKVTNTPDVLNDDVADMGMALLLSAARRVPQADQFVRANCWPGGSFALTRKVTGARLGLVGMGRIGRAIAKRAESFSMTVAYTARSQRTDFSYAYYPTPALLAAQVDFLLVITPGGEGTRGLINAEVLNALGPQGYLINISRGTVVDQSALVDALHNHRIAGAALDVFEDEPHVPLALRENPDVVLTPHMASATLQTRTAMADLVLANLLAHFAGQKLITPIVQ